MPVFFIERDAIRDGTVSIAGPLARHLKGGLRVRPGETVWLGESGGPRYPVRILAASRARLTGGILSESAAPAMPGVPNPAMTPVGGCCGKRPVTRFCATGYAGRPDPTR